MNRMLRFASRVAAVSTALMLTSAPLAIAGPDDGSFVATEAHVDSPKAFWEDNNFSLKTSIKGQTPPVEDTVLWIGKNSGKKQQQYVYEVGHAKGEEFLGEDGTLHYWGPANVYAPDYPIWAGFGADAEVPVDKFRDRSFSLDIVGFNGPGRMESFTYSPWNHNPITRLWSSHDPGLRQTWVSAGSHLHTDTTFTKPGRYEVTYQATARDKEGNLIASEPQTGVWQVGGTRPAEEGEGLGDVREAYNAASADGLPKDPKFTMRKHEGNDIMGAEYLTDLIFETGDEKDDGHAVFFIEGYYLAEVPVEKGRAVWPEMIGSYSSDFQVVYVPDQHGQRWISEPLKYDRSQKEASTSKLGNYPEENTQDPPPKFDASEIKVSNPEVSAGTKIDGETMTVNVTPAEEDLSLYVNGGVYKEGDTHPSCDIKFISTPTERNRPVNVKHCTGDDYEVRFSAIPSARWTEGGTLFQMDPGESQKTKLGDLEAAAAQPGDSDGAGDAENAKPGQNPPSTGNAEGEQQDDANTEANQYEISQGHIDLGPVQGEDGSVSFRLGDESNQYERGKVYRDPDDVTMVVGEPFRETLREEYVSGELSFLGNAGDEIHIVPQVQKGNELWPGFSTEYSGGKAYDIEIEPVSAPEGGEWYAYTSGSFGGVSEMLGSSEGSSRIERSKQIHLHNNWAFTKPGEYVMRMRAVENGGTEATEWENVTFRVGDGKGAGNSGNTGGPGAKPANPAPKPAPAPGTNPTPGAPGANPAPGADPAPGAPGANPGGQGNQGPEAPVADGRVEISQGHIDLGPVTDAGSTEFRLGDESGQHDPGKVFRDPEDVVMLVGDEFQHQLTEDHVAGDMAFLGHAGDTVYMMGQVQKGNELWPGFSTQHAGGTPYDIQIEPVSAPDGGRWFAYTSGTFGGVGEFFGSSDGGSLIERSQPVHMHNNWVFTQPGEYVMRMRALEHGNHGNATGWKNVTFRVGGDSGSGLAAGSVNGGGAGADGAPEAPAAPGAGGGAAGAPAGGASVAPGAKAGAKPAGGAAGAPSAGGGAGAAPAGGKSGGAPGAPGAADAPGAEGAEGAPGAPDAVGADAANAETSGSMTPSGGKGASELTIWDKIVRTLSLILTFVGVGLGGVGVWRRFGPFF